MQFLKIAEHDCPISVCRTLDRRHGEKRRGRPLASKEPNVKRPFKADESSDGHFRRSSLHVHADQLNNNFATWSFFPFQKLSRLGIADVPISLSAVGYLHTSDGHNR